MFIAVEIHTLKLAYMASRMRTLTNRPRLPRSLDRTADVQIALHQASRTTERPRQIILPAGPSVLLVLSGTSTECPGNGDRCCVQVAPIANSSVPRRAKRTGLSSTCPTSIPPVGEITFRHAMLHIRTARWDLPAPQHRPAMVHAQFTPCVPAFFCRTDGLGR